MALVQDELGNWYDDGTDTTYTRYDGTTTTDVTDSDIDWAGNTVVREPMVDTQGNPIDGGWVTRLADGSTKYEDPDGSVYYKNANNTYSITGVGGNTLTYDPKLGNFVDSAGKPISNDTTSIFSKGLDALKGVFTNKDGSTNWGAALSALGGLAAASKKNSNTVPAGYQGSIPTMTAQREMLTAPPVGRRPGSGGINYGGNVTFADQSGNPIGSSRASSIADLTAAAQANPYNAPAQAPAQMGGIRQMDFRAAPMQPPVNSGAYDPAKPENHFARGGLASNGFVVPADVVSHLGNGSTNAGLRLLADKLGAEPIHGQGDGMSDSIKTHIDGKQEARVADGEAFVRPDMVAKLGGGDPEKGAKKLYAMLDRIREARTGTAKQGKEINPDNFMPGGKVAGYATGGTTVPAGVTGMESSLSNWAGPYVTNMLGQGAALATQPYQAYTGPLTAGASDLQNKVFTGLQSTNFPATLGQSFTNAGTPTAGADGQPSGGGGIASSYMNPYLQNVLQPQLAELGRQAKINSLSGIGALTKSGAFGGGRQAIMESEAGRNLLNAQNTAIGTAYANAFDKGREQFNTEQGQGQTLAGIMASQGAAQRGIESEGIAADKAQFEEARLNPYKMVQFQQSLLSGLPLQSQTYNLPPTDNLTQFASGVSTVTDLLNKLGLKP